MFRYLYLKNNLIHDATRATNLSISSKVVSKGHHKVYDNLYILKKIKKKSKISGLVM